MAQPSPISRMPAFSPGPCTTSLLRVGSFFKCTRELLYEQCSLHITLKIPSSVKLGSRPRMARIRSYSSGVIWCDSTTSGVIVLISSTNRHDGARHRLEDTQAVGRPHQ